MKIILILISIRDFCIFLMQYIDRQMSVFEYFMGILILVFFVCGLLVCGFILFSLFFNIESKWIKFRDSSGSGCGGSGCGGSGCGGGGGCGGCGGGD